MRQEDNGPGPQFSDLALSVLQKEGVEGLKKLLPDADPEEALRSLAALQEDQSDEDALQEILGQGPPSGEELQALLDREDGPQDHKEKATSSKSKTKKKTPRRARRAVAEPREETPPRALSQEQSAALLLVLEGDTDQEVAEKTGTTEETVREWRTEDPVFVAAVNARRREQWEHSRDRLRALQARAVGVLAQRLEDPATALQAAVHVLKCTGSYGDVGAPSGPTVPAAVLCQKARAEATAEEAAEPPPADEGWLYREARKSQHHNAVVEKFEDLKARHGL